MKILTLAVSSAAVMLLSSTDASTHFELPSYTVAAEDIAGREEIVERHAPPPTCTETITIHPPLRTDCAHYKHTSTVTELRNCKEGCTLKSIRGDGEWRKTHLFNGMRCTDIQELDEVTKTTVQACRATPITSTAPSPDANEKQFRQLPPPYPPKQHVANESEMWQSINVAIRICCGSRHVASHFCTRDCVQAEAKSSRGDHCRFKCQWKGNRTESCVNTCIAMFNDMFYPN